jgi:hypothetical protein
MDMTTGTWVEQMSGKPLNKSNGCAYFPLDLFRGFLVYRIDGTVLGLIRMDTLENVRSGLRVRH